MIKRVGILRGGIGEHYESSIKRGGKMLSYFLEYLSDKWKPVDIFVDKDGVWHMAGRPIAPADLMHQLDVVWNESHPSLSQCLRELSIPQVTAPHFGHGISKSREMLREHIKEMEWVKIPKHIVLPAYQEDIDSNPDKYAIKYARKVFEKFPGPWMVKANAIHVARMFPELVGAIYDGARNGKNIMVEELIVGKEATVHSVAGFRGDSIYIFSPKNLSREEKERLEGLVKELHSHLGVKHYLKSDFVMHPNGGAYLLNIDFSLDLSPGSSFSQACELVGAKPPSVIEHMFESAFE